MSFCEMILEADKMHLLQNARPLAERIIHCCCSTPRFKWALSSRCDVLRVLHAQTPQSMLIHCPIAFDATHSQYQTTSRTKKFSRRVRPSPSGRARNQCLPTSYKRKEVPVLLYSRSMPAPARRHTPHFSKDPRLSATAALSHHQIL